MSCVAKEKKGVGGSKKMVEIDVSVAAKVSEYLVDPVVRQLGYLFNYRANIEDLSQKVLKLKDDRDRQQRSVDEAIRNGHKIEHCWENPG